MYSYVFESSGHSKWLLSFLWWSAGFDKREGSYSCWFAYFYPSTYVECFHGEESEWLHNLNTLPPQPGPSLCHRSGLLCQSHWSVSTDLAPLNLLLHYYFMNISTFSIPPPPPVFILGYFEAPPLTHTIRNYFQTP